MGPPWGVTTYEPLTQYKSSLKGYLQVADFSEFSGECIRCNLAPTASQMSALEVPFAKADKAVTPLVECALTPKGHGKPLA